MMRCFPTQVTAMTLLALRSDERSVVQCHACCFRSLTCYLPHLESISREEWRLQCRVKVVSHRSAFPPVFPAVFASRFPNAPSVFPQRAIVACHGGHGRREGCRRAAPTFYEPRHVVQAGKLHTRETLSSSSAQSLSPSSPLSHQSILQSSPVTCDLAVWSAQSLGRRCQ